MIKQIFIFSGVRELLFIWSSFFPFFETLIVYGCSKSLKKQLEHFWRQKWFKFSWWMIHKKRRKKRGKKNEGWNKRIPTQWFWVSVWVLWVMVLSLFWNKIGGRMASFSGRMVNFLLRDYFWPISGPSFQLPVMWLPSKMASQTEEYDEPPVQDDQTSPSDTSKWSLLNNFNIK